MVALPCEASFELEYFSGFVCVAPLWLGGLRGKKSTPSVGWEVPVKSLQLASERSEERRHGRTSLISSPFVTVFYLRL